MAECYRVTALNLGPSRLEGLGRHFGFSFETPEGSGLRNKVDILGQNGNSSSSKRVYKSQAINQQITCLLEGEPPFFRNGQNLGPYTVVTTNALCKRKF